MWCDGSHLDLSVISMCNWANGGTRNIPQNLAKPKIIYCGKFRDLIGSSATWRIYVWYNSLIPKLISDHVARFLTLECPVFDLRLPNNYRFNRALEGRFFNFLNQKKHENSLTKFLLEEKGLRFCSKVAKIKFAQPSSARFVLGNYQSRKWVTTLTTLTEVLMIFLTLNRKVCRQ